MGTFTSSAVALQIAHRHRARIAAWTASTVAALESGRMIASVVGCVLATSLITAGAAEASSEVCVAAPSVSYTCNNTQGKGGRVDQVTAFFQKAPASPWNPLPQMCGYSTYLRINAYGNRTFREYRRGVSSAECSRGRAWFDIPVHETFPRGNTYVCMTNYLAGAQQGREMCIKLT